MFLSNFRNHYNIQLDKLCCSERNYFIIINIQCPFYCMRNTKKLVVGKKSGLVELSRASRFSRSLARLASRKFQLVSSLDFNRTGNCNVQF